MYRKAETLESVTPYVLGHCYMDIRFSFFFYPGGSDALNYIIQMKFSLII